MTARKASHGRPRLLADETSRNEVLRVLRAGGTRTDAAASLGMTIDTIANESKRDAQFDTDLKRAEVDGKLALIGRIRKAARTEWRAAAWLLERKWYKEWARREPESISPDQLAHVISNVVAVLLTEIPPKYHPIVREKISGIVTWLSSARTDSPPLSERE